eukprot:CAMPEP_0170627738 /NCGR_PEP_ID=MMETSP0224-20130122/32173_1 /TAXON_ID=285029 /ORGANISM="Togula jolla, Strain CCCM 725" /LENGTH=88 /DNA_ID=CAMNT_0010954841 /DNA_START=1 /DNA_END=264 /DNA_ORIENTATION=+
MAASRLMLIPALLAGTRAAIDVNHCPQKDKPVSMNYCNAGPLPDVSCGLEECPAHSTCSMDRKLGYVCKCDAPFCGDGQHCGCQQDTS